MSKPTMDYQFSESLTQRNARLRRSLEIRRERQKWESAMTSFAKVTEADCDDLWSIYTQYERTGMSVQDATERALQHVVDKKLRPALRACDAAERVRTYLCKSTWAGPLTNNPSLEARLLREMYDALNALGGKRGGDTP